MPTGTKEARKAWPQRLAAVLEVFGIFIAGTLLARLVSRGLDLGPASLRSLPPGQQPDFFRLSWSSASNLILRYGFILGLAFLAGWWHRRRRLRDYGVTMAGRPLREHIAIGIILFALAALPSLLLKFLAATFSLGQMPEHWALIQDLSRPGIWLYLTVGSFGLVPIAEELLARGYIQTRLSEDFGAPAAILITALFFTLSHTQYFIASAAGMGMVGALLLFAVAFGYVRHRTESVVPGMIAHMCSNLPFRGWAVPTMLAIMIALIVWRWRAVSDYAVRLWRDLVRRDVLGPMIQALLLIIMLVALVLLAPRILPVLAVLALVAAVALEYREKRRS